MSESITIVEIEVPYCALTYGTSPCTAAIGVTGDDRCYNMRRTCQDVNNFTPAPLVLRFCRAGLPAQWTFSGSPVAVIPSLGNVGITPAEVHPGVDIGLRESISVELGDHPHSDAGLDKYLADRAYDAFARGTLWGKLRARLGSLQGQTLRIRRGVVGQDLDDMLAWTYVISALAGQDKSVSITAKDPLALCDPKNAKAPLAAQAKLSADLDASSTSITLTPAGIGDIEFSTSGKAVIGGGEVVAYTRTLTSDTLTIDRAESGTAADEHDEGDTVQPVLIYTEQTPAEILYDLFVTYTPGFDPAWITLAEWEAEISTYYPDFLYSAEIAKPESVQTLVNELIEQTALIVWWDALAAKLRLRALRVVDAADLLDEQRYGADTFRVVEQPNLRVSQVWTYVGLRNPTERLEEKNFSVVVATVSAEADGLYSQSAIKTIFSRWIPSGLVTAAESLNNSLLDRFIDAPRKFELRLHPDMPDTPALADTRLVKAWMLQDASGAQVEIGCDVVSVQLADEGTNVDLQESGAGLAASPEKTLAISETVYIGLNLREYYDNFFASVDDYDTITFIVLEDVLITGEARYESGDIPPNTPTPALFCLDGDWPEHVTIRLVLQPGAIIAGRGGYGYFGLGGNGGTGILTTRPLEIDNGGIIGGGGGGGGGAHVNEDGSNKFGYGGGAACRGPGGGNSFLEDGNIVAGPAPFDIVGQGQNATDTAGGAGGNGPSGFSHGGAGGALGAAGTAGSTTGGTTPSTGGGGSAGAAIDGDSFVTYINAGDIRGAQIN